ncbi:hypothetical protein LXL04_013180 [Taraxacum kok-saghyz]
MKSLEKFGRKFTMHKNDGKEKRDHQASAHLDELVQASKDMQDIRSSYDGLIAAAAAMTNSIFEFSESLHEMGTCLLEKTTSDVDAESGRVLSTLGNIQAELQKIADSYRSYVIVTITNPSESLLSELRKVEEMKLQCDEKRGVYEYMMSQHKEKGKLRSEKKAETSVAKSLQEAQEEYNEAARLCAFRVKSLKEGQCRSLLTQATRHHAAQLNFFRKGFKALEAVDPVIKIVAEKHRIDCQLTGFDDVNGGGDDEGIDDGELSFDFGQIKHGVDNHATSINNPMEVDRPDIPHPQVLISEDRHINHYYKHQGDHQDNGKQSRVSSYSAPLYPEKADSSDKPRESQPQHRHKFHSYALPPPTTPVYVPPHSNPFSKLQEKETDNEKREIDDTAIQLPPPSHSRTTFDSKVAKRQAYSGPLLPTKPFSSRISSASGPISSSELPRSVSPTGLSSPRISELHELPRPPSGCVKPGGGVNVTGLSGPLFIKKQERSPPSKSPVGSPLPPPPLVVPRSFSIHSSNPSAMESPRVSSPPLTPILLSNFKSRGHT